MSDQEKYTTASSNDSGSETYFTDPPQDLEELTTRYSGETAIQDESQQPSPRVRFRSTGGLLQNAPRRHGGAEWDRSQREGLPHRPTAPYTHGTEDIADTPLNERSQNGQEPADQNDKDQVEGPETKEQASRSTTTPQTLNLQCTRARLR